MFNSKNIIKFLGKIILIIYVLLQFYFFNVIHKNKLKETIINVNYTKNFNKKNKVINTKDIINQNNSNNKCYGYIDNKNITVIHLIITRFLIEFPTNSEYSVNIKKKEYLLNGIRVLKKYLLPSLESQSCKNFIWLLILGNNLNINYIKSMINFNYSFEFNVIYKKNLIEYILFFIKITRIRNLFILLNVEKPKDKIIDKELVHYLIPPRLHFLCINIFICFFPVIFYFYYLMQ